jgi:predicted enzyme related to lactoylglutathione lyase
MSNPQPVVHFEMPFTDPKRVSDFYTNAFGWNMMQLGNAWGGYVLAQTGETDDKGILKKTNMINGGFFEKDESKPMQQPSVVIGVDNIQASMKAVKDAGGELLGEPVDIPDYGTYISFIDSEGNRVGMIQGPKMN